MWLDLEPYYNKSPYSVRKSSSLARIFQLFRTVGLRHLAVVTVHNQVWLRCLDSGLAALKSM